MNIINDFFEFLLTYLKNIKYFSRNYFSRLPHPIRSKNHGSSDLHPQHWVIEGSNTGKDEKFINSVLLLMRRRIQMNIFINILILF